MSEIEFEENRYNDLSAKRRFQNKSGMVSLLLKIGVTKSENIANIILICISLLLFAMSFVIYFTLSKWPNKKRDSR